MTLTRSSTRLLAVAAMAALLAVGCDDGGAPAVVASTEPTTATTSAQPETTTAPTVAGEPVRFFDEVPAMHPSIDGYAAGEVEIAAPTGERWLLPVRLATTPEERSHGFMEVPEVPVGTGMLFVFEGPSTGGFWMKGTLTALDLAYIDAEGTVVTTHTMQPCEADPCPSYPPRAPYETVLEVTAGFWEQIGLDLGWTITKRG